MFDTTIFLERLKRIMQPKQGDIPTTPSHRLVFEIDSGETQNEDIER